MQTSFPDSIRTLVHAGIVILHFVLFLEHHGALDLVVSGVDLMLLTDEQRRFLWQTVQEVRRKGALLWWTVIISLPILAPIVDRQLPVIVAAMA